MMKKITLFAAGALMLGMTSCLGGDDPKSETTYNVPTFAVATNSKGETTVSNGTVVTFGMDNVSYSTTVKFTDLSLGGENTTFTTAKIPFRIGQYAFGQNQATVFYLVEAANATGEGADVTDLNADLTMATNTINPNVREKLNSQLAIDPVVYPGNQAQPTWYTCIQFKTGDYSVMTFWNDMIYTGDGNVANPSGAMFTDKAGIIRVKLNLAKAGEYKANVYFYNYKFKEGENNEQNFVFTDVPVTFGAHGFTVQANDVTPVSLQDKKAIEEYKMTNLTVSSTKKMTSIQCNFSLEDRSAGSFQGTGLYEFSLSDIKQ